jgi:hypothetical protein
MGAGPNQSKLRGVNCVPDLGIDGPTTPERE